MTLRCDDYICGECGAVSELFLQRDAGSSVACPVCAQGTASRVFPAPTIGTSWAGSVIRGKSDKRPDIGVMDTRPLADGMPIKEWKAKRREMYARKDRDEIKAKI